MKSLIIRLLVVVVVCLFVAVSVCAQMQQVPGTIVPRLVKFSGTLLDEQGHALKGPVGATFALYAQQSGGAALWMETQDVKPDATGNYTALLGSASANGIPEELFASGEARWLGVQAEKQPEQPRVLLVSVPYALKAGDAQTLGGLPASAFLQAQGTSASPALLLPTGTSPTGASPSGSSGSSVPTASIGGSGSTGTFAIFTGAATIGNSLITQNGGAAVVSEALQLPTTGTATSTLKFNSQPFDLLASSFNSSTLAAVPQHFRWQVEPVRNNTTSPSGKLSLLFASGAATPAETGLSIGHKGIITFAPGQTMPTVAGNETVTGNLTANGSVSGASASFTGTVTTGNETVNGNVTATGAITGQTANFTGNNTTQIVNVTQSGTGIALAAGNGGTSGDAAFFFLNNASNPSDVLDLFLPFGSHSNLLQGFGRSGGSSFVVDANGNISTFGGTLSSSGNVTINSSSFGGMALNAVLGPVNITAGNAGPVNITAGSISAADPGGAVNITGGSGGPGGQGGNILLTPGLGGPGAPPGTVQTPSEIRMGSESGGTDPPVVTSGYQGLVVRRINSTTTTAGSKVARTDTMTLIRDGTAPGFQIAVAAGTSHYSIACLGLTSTTTVVGFTDSFIAPSMATTVQVFNQSDLMQFNCTFGDTSQGHVTEVNLLRNPSDATWVGTVTSTFNQ